MTSKNDITGDKLITKPSSNYASGWDAIWGKREPTSTTERRPTDKSGSDQAGVAPDEGSRGADSSSR